jgi:hypothetical protein
MKSEYKDKNYENIYKFILSEEEIQDIKDTNKNNLKDRINERRKMYKIKNKPDRSIYKLMDSYNSNPKNVKIFRSSVEQNSIKNNQSLKSSENEPNILKIQSRANNRTKKKRNLKIVSYFQPTQANKKVNKSNGSSSFYGEDTPPKECKAGVYYHTQCNSPKASSSVRDLIFSQGDHKFIRNKANNSQNRSKVTEKTKDIRHFITSSTSHSRGTKNHLKTSRFGSGMQNNTYVHTKKTISDFFKPKHI